MTNNTNSQLPADIHAETTILGAIMLDPDRLLDVRTVLSPNDFYLSSNAKIYATMMAMEDTYESIDLVTLSRALTTKGQITEVGGIAYLASLTEGLPRRTAINDYMLIVKDKALARQVIAFAHRIASDAFLQNRPAVDVAIRGLSTLQIVAAAGAVKQESFSATELSDDAEYRLLDNPVSPSVIHTGISALDDKLRGGIRPGQLIIVGAAPSRGKTTEARQMGVSAASTGHPVWVYSGEMSKESWCDHSACVLAGLPTDNLQEPQLYDASEKVALRSALKAFGKLPIWVCDDASITLDHIIAEATRHVRQHGVEVVIVDYAQLVIAPGRDPKERISAVAQRLRRLSKESNVAVVLLSQLARPEGRNINHRPSMIDLKESGDLEAAAHVVLLNFCPIGDTGTFTGKDEIIVGKQRFGTLGSVPVTLNGSFSRFDSR